MRITRIIQTFAAARKKVDHQQTQRSIIRNLNLCFDAGPLLLFVQPLHPKLQKQNSSSIVIDSKSSVLTFSFVPKPTDQDNLDRQWNYRRNLHFRFQQIGYLLDIESGNGTSHRFLSPCPELEDADVAYKVTDLVEKKQIQFSIEGKKPFTAATSHSEYESIQEIIKSSLMDLSGLRLCYDLRRQEQVDEVKKNLEKRIKQNKQKEDMFPAE